MIPNTREGRLCTGRSSNRPDVVYKPLPDRLYKSATATETARPLNFSTVGATSMLSQEHSKPGRPSVAKIICSVVAQLRAFNLVSATQCGAVFRCVTSAC